MLFHGCFGVFASGEFVVDFLRRGSLNSLVQLPFTSAVKGKYLCTFNTVVVILHQNFDMAYYFVTVFCQVQCQWFPFSKFELEKKSE